MSSFLWLGWPAQTAASDALATTIVVNSTADGTLAALAINTTCDLREAIEAANTNMVVGQCQAGMAGPAMVDTITFAPGVTGTITLMAGELAITDALTITGPGAQSLTISGNNASRVFSIGLGAGDVTLSELTIANGRGGVSRVAGPGAFYNSAKGGGILNNSTGTLTIHNSVITGNTASASGGSGNIGYGGGIFNSSSGTVKVTNSVITGNSASASGGNDNIGYGGGIYNFSSGTVNVTNSTLTGNTALASGGSGNSIDGIIIGSSNTGYGGGIFNSSSGTVNVTHSTLIGNTASASGGSGNFGVGGGIYNFGGTVKVTNSTLTGNTVSASGGSTNQVLGGGIYNYGTVDMTDSTLTSTVNVTNSTLTGTVNVTNSTLTGNTASVSGGSRNFGNGGGIFNSGTASVRSTIIAENSATTSGPDVAGTFTSSGYNLIGNGFGNSCGSTSFTQPTDKVGTAEMPINPLLAPLDFYGGPTPTHALLPGSPAINAGDNCVLTAGGCGTNNPPTALTTDQRGAGFPRNLGGTVDIGAFEFGVCPTITVTNPITTTGTVGVAFSQSFTQSGGGTGSFSTSSTLPTGLNLSSNGTLSGTPTQAGTFPIIVTATDRSTCMGTGTTYTLNINCPLITASLSGSAAICPSGSATVSVNVNGGSGPYTVTLSDGQSKTSSSLPITFTVSPSTMTTYSLQSATDAYGCNATLSGSATVMVNTTTSISQPLQPQSKTIGQSATFSVTATGTNLSYQWRKNGNPINGATASSYSIAAVVPSDAGNYDVVVNGTCGQKTSTPVSLTVNCQSITVTNPTVTTGTAGTYFSQSFTQAGGNGTISFSKTGALPQGMALASNGLLSGTPTQSGSFPITVTATDVNGCTGASQTYTLNINCPQITATLSGSAAICPSGSATLSVNLSGGNGPYTVTLSNGQSKTSSSLPITFSVSPSATTIYSIQSAKDVYGCNATTNGSATVTVNTTTSISQSPMAQSKLVGQSAVFSVTAAGTNLSYQWRKNGNPINGATASSFSIAAVVPSDAGNYDVVVNGACGSATSSAASLSVNGVRGDARFSTDYDGDGKADLAIWRAATATFWVYTSASGSTITKQLGVSTDVPVPGDYDGDGKTDFALWRPATGAWLVFQSSNGQTPNWQWGNATDVPVPGDYDGDGKTDLAIWRPSNGTWMIYKSTGGTMTTQWGMAGDLPVPGDYDGDGKTDLAVWRAATYWIYSPATNTTTTKQWGVTTDVPVPEDYDGDGKADIAVWRPSTATFMICHSTNGATVSGQWGSATDVPVPGDYDGDGKADYAIWRPSNGTWMIFKSTNGGTSNMQWGYIGDLPVR